MITIRNNIIEAVEKNKIIVIVRGVEREKILPLAEAMFEGGIRLIEFTYDARGNMPDEENAANIEAVAKRFGGELLVGAGTVLTEKQVELTARAGGSFIISPDTNPEVIARTKACGLVSIPGALTPTEVAVAHRSGADFVKLFPVNYYGPKYIKDISAPLSHVKLLAVGGITVDNMTDYLSAGACGVGVGTGIVDKKLVADGNFAAITELAKKFTRKI